MKGIFDILRPKIRPEPTEEKHDSILFSTAFAGLGVDASLLIPWEARAVEIDHRHLAAVLQQHAHSRQAHGAGGAGDDGNLAFQELMHRARSSFQTGRGSGKSPLQ